MISDACLILQRLQVFAFKIFTPMNFWWSGTNHSQMYSLPENVLVKIFSYLTPSQRGLARQVCRAWETASSHPMLLQTSALCLVGSFGGLSLRQLLWNERIKLVFWWTSRHFRFGNHFRHHIYVNFVSVHYAAVFSRRILVENVPDYYSG